MSYFLYYKKEKYLATQHMFEKLQNDSDEDVYAKLAKNLISIPVKIIVRNYDTDEKNTVERKNIE